MKHRNTHSLVRHSAPHYAMAIESSLMQVTISSRKGKIVEIPGAGEVVEFINCSYLGLDLHEDVVAAAQSTDEMWGVNFCCARSRFSILPQKQLEEELSELFGGRAITFPSVTTTHMSVLPLIASGALLNPENPPSVKIIFDKYSHSSMQYLKPILATEAEIATIEHNDLLALRTLAIESLAKQQTVVYVADGIYSMGGLAPIKELLEMSQELGLYIYLDDAHGTSIFGNRGEGAVLDQLPYGMPDNLFISFCLSKGFGCNGGGILLPNVAQENIVRTYGQIYAFSAALDFSVVNACLAAVKLHRDGTIQRLQQDLRKNVALYDELMGVDLPFSPIRVAMVGDEIRAINLGKEILKHGFFVSVVFFPIVPRGKARLRICIAANHTSEQVIGLTDVLKKLLD